MGSIKDWEFKSQPVPAAEFLGKRVLPAVLHFQPEQFAILQDPEDLRLWERNMAERVGLSAALGEGFADNLVANGSSCTESGCPSNDCDVD